MRVRGSLFFRTGVVAFVLCCLVLITGCGSGTGKTHLEGSAAFDAQPISKGRIMFRSEAGRGYGGDVTDGAYSVSTKGDVVGGSYRVEITAERSTGKTVRVAPYSEPTEVMEQYIPARYNASSTLLREITAGKTNVHDFDLEP